MSDEQPEPLDKNARDVQLARILDDYLLRRSRGEPVTEAELLARYPNLAKELRKMLATVRDLRGTDRSIHALIRQGILDRSTDPRYRAELGAYKITGFIGRGGMGIVLKADEESLNRTVALKILRPELSDDVAALSRFTREAKAAGTLRHPNIVTVHAIGEEHDVRFLAMEYVEGPSLARVIREGGALPAETVRVIFRQLLSGLAAAHRAGLIHRDIKPSNIILDGWPREAEEHEIAAPREVESARNERTAETLRAAAPTGEGGRPTTPPNGSPSVTVKIADFGLARMLTAETLATLTDSVLGTPDYMGPEQARGDEDIDHRADLYSAGVVLYEMLTGRTPFRAEAPTATIHQILHDDPPDPRKLNGDVDRNLATLALRLMAKRPEDRLASATEATAVLDAKTGVGSPERRRRARRRMALGLLALAVVAGGSWIFSRFGAQSESTTSGPEATPRIAHAWVPDTADPEYEQLKRSVLVRYGDDLTPRVFHEFPTEVSRVAAVKLLNLDAGGAQAIVAGLVGLSGGHNLFAFDAWGNEIWSLGISNVTPGYRWPDCGPSGEWMCHLLEVGDLDGIPGDELVVVAKDPDNYSARIAVVDPRTPKIRSTYWHMGHLEDLWIFDAFLGPGRPAIVVKGCNNKLDGFGDPPPRPYTGALPGEDAPRTEYDIVDVLVVLDPADMNGVGPPRTNAQRLDMPAARPFAYAFLDMPATVRSTYVRDGQKVHPDPHDVGYIESVTLRRKGGAGAPALLRVCVYYAPSASGLSAVQLSLGPDLHLLDASSVSGVIDQKAEEEWHRLWRPIVQNGKYVDE